MIPTVITTRERYEGINNAMGTKVGAESNVVHWSDSDIPYLQQLAEPGRMEAVIGMGILNCIIGAKITDKVQPMDAGSGIKVLKTTAHTAICVGTENSLTKFVMRAFEEIRSMDQLKLSSTTESIIIDCIQSDFKIDAPIELQIFLVQALVFLKNGINRHICAFIKLEMVRVYQYNVLTPCNVT